MMGRLKDSLVNFFMKRTVRSLVRGLFKALAGGLTAHGLIESGTAEQFILVNSEVVIGGILFLLAQGASHLDKLRNDLKED